MIRRRIVISTLLLLLVSLTGTAGVALGSPKLHTGRALPVQPFGVHGTVSVSQNAQTHAVTVELDLSGFAPDTRHIMHIHNGLMCAMMASRKVPMMAMGKILVPLGIHRSDASGDMRETFTVRTSRVVHFGAVHLMVHHGPTITTEQGARPVTCADIH